jgi:hypothetical protein
MSQGIGILNIESKYRGEIPVMDRPEEAGFR